MSSFKIDLAQKGLSLYTVPVAWALAFLPHAYSVAAAGKFYDPANPRKLESAIAADDKTNKILKERILRAQAASKNATESLGVYSAAVVAANAAGVDASTTNVLALAYIVSRIVYNVVYVRLQDNRNWAPVRSIVWMIGVGLFSTLYIKAASKMAST